MDLGTANHKEKKTASIPTVYLLQKKKSKEKKRVSLEKKTRAGMDSVRDRQSVAMCTNVGKKGRHVATKRAGRERERATSQSWRMRSCKNVSPGIPRKRNGPCDGRRQQRNSTRRSNEVSGRTLPTGKSTCDKDRHTNSLPQDCLFHRLTTLGATQGQRQGPSTTRT